MPKADKRNNGLLDTWGRRNRKHADKECQQCGKAFRPKRASSRYCSRRCAWGNNGKHQERKQEYWRVGEKGYIVGTVWVDGKKVSKRQHRWIMEQHLGRTLGPQEVVHHINGDKQDNRLENLQVIQFGAHSALHHKMRRES